MIDPHGHASVVHANRSRLSSSDSRVISRIVEPGAVPHVDNVFRQVERSSDDDHGYEEEEERICQESQSLHLSSHHSRGATDVACQSEIHTEDKFLSWCKHVKGKGDLVLIAFTLKPAEEGGCIAHGSEGVR